ncbi:M4 family metallopeptidase, partial [Candidatus Protochlamydia sp. W-9]|uniref:M4 family metallopeptidase n=1 Tax=Candidatus Protochlamydia sp. W-9 TaxID=1785087 RepID=UPI002A4E1150
YRSKMGAYLSEAYGSDFPYPPIQIRSYTGEEIKQLGYQALIYNNEDEKEIYSKIHGIVETIKEFYWTTFQLVGVDEEGTIPPFFVHYPEKNAYYALKLKHFAFNNEFASQPDVVCHEMTHAVIENHNSLGNQGEAGALNEAIADIVAIAFKRKISGIDKGWEISTFRDLSTAPKKFKSVVNYNKDNDYGYVHDNSLIISHTFYLASTSLNYDSTRCDLLLGIWFKSMLNLKDKTFTGFKSKTLEANGEVFFQGGSIIINAIKKAWQKTSHLFPKT